MTGIYAPPMRIRSWIEHLSKKVVAKDLLREVKGSADLAAAMAEPRSLHNHTLFVMYDRETVSPGNHQATPLRQASLSTVLALVNYRDRRGDDGLSDLEAVREALSRALLGWEPPGAAGEVSFESGNLVDFGRRTLWWRDSWSVPAFAPAPAPEDPDCDAPSAVYVRGCPVPLSGVGPPLEGERTAELLYRQEES